MDIQISEEGFISVPSDLVTILPEQGARPLI